MFTAKSFDLGPLGTLVELHVPQPSKEEKSSSAATPVIILDQSGSMGQWAARYPSIISDALIQAGFPANQKVEFITFASSSAQSSTTVSGLRSKGVESRGGTYMSGAVNKMKSLVKSTPDANYQLIVVSDGQLHDMDRTLASAETLRRECDGHAGTIDTSLVRLITSSYGSPDTRALSCLGQLSASQVDVLDLDGYSAGFSDELRSTMVHEIEKTLRGCQKIELKFSAPVASASLTGDGVEGKVFAFNAGRQYILAPQGVDTANLEVECEGRTHKVEKHDGSFTEEHIMGYLKFLDSKMRMLAVVGSDSTQQSLKKMSEWLSGLESVLASFSSNNEDDKKQEQEAPDYTLAARKKVLIAKVLKSQKGIINSLKQLANVDAVVGLNSQQKADFLRGVSNNKSGRGLARRAAKTAEEATPDELAVEGVQNLARVTIPTHEESVVSFVSHATAPECLELAAELTDLVDQGVGAIDLLQLIGLPGISFVAHQGNYVDPWSFRVKQTFTGDSCMLSQSDLWHSMNATGSREALKCPGFDTAITGVDPVRSPNPEAYDCYIDNARGINKLHASVSMRGLIAPVNDDEHAIKTAVTLNLINVCANGGGTESVLEKLKWEMEDMTTLRINKTIKEHMASQEPGAFFTGDKGIGNVMRLYAAILGWRGMDKEVSPLQKQRILRDMYSLVAYHKLKHVEDREEAIQRLLGLDMEKNGTHLSKIGEPNATYPVHCSDFSIDAGAKKSFGVLSPNEGALVMRARELADIDSLSKLSNGVDVVDAYGIDNEAMWTVAIMVQALKCKKASDRVDTTDGARKMLLDHFTNAEQCQSYLSSVSYDMYKTDYDKRLAQKTAEEARVKMLKLVDDIIQSDSMEDFLELMQQVPNRSCDTFGLVLEALVQSSDTEVLRFQKMWVCLLGRNVDGDPVWNGGNCLVGDLSKYCDTFRMAGRLKMWDRLKEVRAMYPLHHYRDMPNRHGHSNDFPSYYFWGYQSLDHFKEGVDEATFNEYCAAHAKRGCCGLGV